MKKINKRQGLTKKAKARLVILGYEDPQIDSLPRDSPTLGRDSRMLALTMHFQPPMGSEILWHQNSISQRESTRLSDSWSRATGRTTLQNEAPGPWDMWTFKGCLRPYQCTFAMVYRTQRGTSKFRVFWYLLLTLVFLFCRRKIPHLENHTSMES